MDKLFRGCRDVLAAAMCPIHYGRLTELGLEKIATPARGDLLQRAKEDVREKMLGIGRFGTAYVPQPVCLAIFRRWFRQEQMEVINNGEGIDIPYDTAAFDEAFHDALMRVLKMDPKGALPQQRARRIANGLVIEKHVAGWFRHKFMRQYHEPENVNQWDRWCRNDFRLTIGKRIFGVDVMGPGQDGEFHVSATKPTTDVHLMAERTLTTVHISGFELGDRLRPHFGSENVVPICRLIVLLHCQSNGWDYHAMKNIAKRRGGRP